MSSPDLTAAFAKVFANGTGQVGLEVGTDPGLPVSDWIQIPRSLEKKVAFRVVKSDLAVWEKNVAAFNPGAPSTGTQDEELTEPAAAAKKYGWVFAENIMVVVTGGKRWAKAGNVKVLVDKALQRAPTPEDAKAFYTVNLTAVRPQVLNDKERMMAHAVRFWSVVAGLVTSTKTSEYRVVDDPTEYARGADDFAEYAVKFQAQAFTAAAARAGNWRKSNHATGGPIATGFAATWLRKENFTVDGVDARDHQATLRRITDAFYVATHAVSVHAVLAVMAPSDEGHWAEIDPSYGIVMEWAVMDSARIRLEGKTQVAGAAMIADSVVTLRTLIREGLGPLLNAKSEAKTLLAMHSKIERLGVRGAVYSSWFMDGHPEGLKPEPFSQKGQGCDNIIGELAYVATKYYAMTTIGKSPSLASAASQLGSPNAEQAWSSLAADKRTMTATQIVAAYKIVKQSSADTDISKLTSDKQDVVRAAIVTYNAANTELADIAGVDSVIKINEQKVLAALASSSVPATGPNVSIAAPQVTQ